MKLVILINDEHEDERALYDREKEEVLLKGDYVNDEIDAKIDGFIECLKYFEVQFELEDDAVWLTPEDELFGKCNFYY